VLARGIFFIVGAFCYALLNILSQLSKEPDGSYAYSMPTVVLSSEFVKLCLSLGFLRAEKGSVRATLKTISSTSLVSWLLFALPAVLYAVNNNLDMLNNQYMDPATESVLVQGKILTTGVAWWLVFNKPMATRKWLALVLLFVGCCGAGWPSTAESKEKSTFIEPFGVLLIALYVCISASAGVYNEWLYKNMGKADSIHMCNIRIYVTGCLFCLVTHFGVGEGSALAPGFGGLFKGYNMYTWALVATYSMMGLLLAQVMKLFDSIVKLFISGSSMYVSALLTVVIFGRWPSVLFLVSMALVTLAILLYNLEYITLMGEVKKGD